MSVFVTAIATLLVVNAVVSFFIAFFWQVKVILTVFRVSDGQNASIPWKALADQNSPQNTLGRFFAGEIFPELRRKWLRAITYVAISFAIMFLVVGFLMMAAPEYLL
jgi:hypothetical protein